MAIRIKRVYDPPAKDDGFRVLVDRLWPRGINKEKAQIDLWLKDIAPSTELRRRFGHDPDKWREFKHHYFDELKQRQDALSELRNLGKRRKLTLLYAAKDTAHNNAVALKDYLEHC